jgi:hypothetical protein
MNMERLDARKLLQLIEEQNQQVNRFQEGFLHSSIKDIRVGTYKAAVLLRDYRIVEMREFIPQFDPAIVMNKLFLFVGAWHSQTLCFAVALPVRAPIDEHTFNNYLIVSCETSFHAKGRVYQIHGENKVTDVREVNNSDEVIAAQTILTDSAIRPYLSLFHLALSYN